MIEAYVGSAAVSDVIYFALSGNAHKKRISMCVCAAFIVRVIHTGGHYGIFGKNGITPDWTAGKMLR
ncbi:hypothetical protein CES85_4510 [Ochrobactrum quorumnocens]|uniref:Uncharacterized protein n=1 Tax=Ochrobactrum quorumnocens TaxID=271865 RepID=A0A248UAB0_9HYPH|nr:hypothetical protein [[Ochrobactrum] quorumnocens]ASV83727.1 hypothetical protein CES85_4510 [[Ochrobactrum] quorumnocens]